MVASSLVRRSPRYPARREDGGEKVEVEVEVKVGEK